MQPDVAAIPLLGTTVDAPDETHSRVCELEDKVKDLERKVANLFMDNVAFATKLKAKSEMERQQQEEITSLKERLVQALKAQVIICSTATLLLNTLHSMSSCVHNRKLRLKSSHCQRPENWNVRTRYSHW